MILRTPTGAETEEKDKTEEKKEKKVKKVKKEKIKKSEELANSDAKILFEAVREINELLRNR